MKKLKSISLKIIEILYEVFVWYVFLVAGAVSIAVMCVIPQFGLIVLLGASGVTAIIQFEQYLKHKREK